MLHRFLNPDHLMSEEDAPLSRVLLDENWLAVFGFLDAEALSRCALVCVHWRSLAREDGLLWKPLCASLWEGKQNLELERWVRPLPAPAGEAGGSDDPPQRADALSGFELFLAHTDPGQHHRADQALQERRGAADTDGAADAQLQHALIRRVRKARRRRAEAGACRHACACARSNVRAACASP